MSGHGDHPTRAALSLVDAYEDLRGSVTGGPASAGGLGGRAILARRGMAAWMRAVAQTELPPTSRWRSTTPTILSASVESDTQPVNDHDFRSLAKGVAIPYVVYDTEANRRDLSPWPDQERRRPGSVEHRNPSLSALESELARVRYWPAAWGDLASVPRRGHLVPTGDRVANLRNTAAAPASRPHRSRGGGERAGHQHDLGTDSS